MRKWLALLAVAALAPIGARAQQVTSFPPAALPLTGAETVYLVQNGHSVQTPVSSIQANGSFSSVNAGSLSVTGASSFNTGQFSGKLSTAASNTANAGLNIAPGTGPTSPVNGDVWTTATGMYVQINGATVGPLGTGGGGGSGTQNQLGWFATTGSTVTGLPTANSSVLVTNGSGVPGWSLTLPNNLTANLFTPQIKNYTIATLPTVTASNQGQMAWASDCQNGTQGSGSGTGCLYVVNNAGAWAPVPTIPTQTITIGGQAIQLGGATANQGTGAKIATATGTWTNGDCLQVGSNGAVADAGAACGGGTGGSGTVTAAVQNSLPYYSAAGSATTLSGMSIVNNAVLVTSSSGVPSESTTLPSGLTIPSPTISTPALTGSGTYVTLTGTGKLTTAASTTAGAGLNLPPGTAPTSPANGDVWVTGTGLFVRAGGTTFGPLSTGTGSVTSIATTGPISGGTITTSGTISCPTCATTTNGGLLTATSPVAISAAGVIGCTTCVTSSGGGAMTASTPITVSAAGQIACATCLTSTSGGALAATAPVTVSGNTIALGNQTSGTSILWDANSNVTANTYHVFQKWPRLTGSIQSITYQTGGSNSPAFNIAIQVNGTNVTSCNGITVNSSTPTTTTCGSNSIIEGQPVDLVVSGISGTPNSAAVQINWLWSAGS